MQRSSLYVPLIGLALLCAAPWVRAQTVPPLPSVAGVELAADPDKVRSRLGAPEHQSESLGLRFWDYPRRGVTVIWREGEARVHGIVVSRSTAGDIGGVRVGDAESRLREVWGTAVRVRQGGRFVDFAGENWVLSAEVKEGRVVQMTLMRPIDHSSDMW